MASGVTVDFGKTVGAVRPLHGVCQPPFMGKDFSLFHYLTEAHIPYSRLHDVGGAYGGSVYVDIPNIFRDFDADVNDPASYDFVFTDQLMSELVKAGIEPYYRLGVTIENQYRLKAYRIHPPKDYMKWAQICEHIVRHYNEGWADGFRFGITYWEIWNEPEGEKTCQGGAMWLGTAEQYFRLYEVTANHLKRCFGDSIKVGGYSACGFSACDEDPDLNGTGRTVYENHAQQWIDFFHRFLKYISSPEHRAPLDFFSWHSYTREPKLAKTYSDYCRRVLTKYGFGDVPDIFAEWNPAVELDTRNKPLAGARALGIMLALQTDCKTQAANYYDARISASRYAGMFNPDTWQPYPSYYAFKMFGDAYAMGSAVETVCTGDDLYAMGAVDGEGHKLLLIANVAEQDIECDIEALNAGEVLSVSRVDEDNYVPSEEKIEGRTVTLKKTSYMAVRFA